MLRNQYALWFLRDLLGCAEIKIYVRHVSDCVSAVLSCCSSIQR